MPRLATGAIETYEHKDGRTVTFRVRVRAYGRRWRVNLGTNHQGWSEPRARVELDRIMQQVERGTWEPPLRRTNGKATEEVADETFHVFASRWWAEKRATLRENAQADYEWRLAHLLSWFRDKLVAEIGRRDVDEYRAAKIAEAEVDLPEGRKKPLSPRSINMTLELLAQVLDRAVDWEILPGNPARGRGVRMKLPKRRRNFLDPDMVVDGVNEAGSWERSLPEHQRYGQRAFFATLCLAGPRISELCDATIGDLDLDGGRLRIPDAKSEAGVRDVDLTAFLLDELVAHVAEAERLGRPTGPDKPLFRTRTGGRLNPSNVRNRLLAGVTERVNEYRGQRGAILLPAGVTPHTLRRTFASLCFAAGRDPRWVMSQIGHEDARLTLEVYAQTVDRRTDRALVWSVMRFADEPDARAIGTTTGPTGMMARSRHVV